MAYTDAQGYPVSTSSSSALAAYEQGVSLWIRWRGGALEALDSAIVDDPHFALAHCTRAYLGWRMSRGDIVLDAHQQVLALADNVHDRREHLHTQVVDAIRQQDHPTTLQRLEELVVAYPTDRVANQVLNFVYSARGDKQRALTQARRSLAASPGDPHFLTMTAFYLEQSNTDADEGLQLGLRALAADPGNLYTYHAVGHNYQGRGAYEQCLATFERANSIEHYPHLLWHLAEAHAILGDTRLTRDYWASTAPALPLFERIELQWRLEMLRGAPVDMSIWQDLARQGEHLLAQAEYLTIWMHHWIGLALARAGDMAKAEQQVVRLRRLPEGRAGGYWSTLGATLLEGEMALIRGDLVTAAQLMMPAIQHMHDLGGGSREQKDIFVDVFLEVQRRLGNTEAVIELAQRRLQKNPNHFQSLAALAWAYRYTGQTSRQHQTYQELINRAKAVPVDAHLPALLEACQALNN
jgi:tetratricopeptide (TPR) repeat protein